MTCGSVQPGGRHYLAVSHKRDASHCITCMACFHRSPSCAHGCWPRNCSSGRRLWMVAPGLSGVGVPAPGIRQCLQALGKCRRVPQSCRQVLSCLSLPSRRLPAAQSASRPAEALFETAVLPTCHHPPPLGSQPCGRHVLVCGVAAADGMPFIQHHSEKVNLWAGAGRRAGNLNHAPHAVRTLNRLT
jgi:hypothetical protein